MTILVSHSQATTFERCEQKWWLAYGEKLSPKAKDGKNHLHIGTLVHSALDKHYTGTSIDDIQTWILANAENMESAATSLQLVTRYVRDYAPTMDNEWRVAKTEDHFQIPLRTPKGRSFEFQGYIDLAVYQGDYLYLMDHKTSARNRYTKESLTTEWQLLLYGAALREEGLEIDGVGVNGFNTTQYKNFWQEPIDKIFYRVSVYQPAAMFDNSLELLGRVVDEMEDLLEGRQPRKVISKSCAWCQFKEICVFQLKNLNDSAEQLKQIAFTVKPSNHELKFEEAEGEISGDYS